MIIVLTFLKDGQSYRLDIIDTAGQEEYRDMLGSLFSTDLSIDAYVLVYDITSEISLENLEHFAEMIEKAMDIRPPGSTPPVKLVAANKCDLSENRVISSQQGLQWAKSHGCKFMETSAKAMVNIEETFEIIIRQVAANRREAEESANETINQSKVPPSASRPNLRSKLSTVNIRHNHNNNEKTPNTPQQAPPKKRSGCCTIA